MPSGGMVTMARVAVAIELHEEPAGMVVQGTLKTITITLTDEATGVLTDPTAISVELTQPSGAQSSLTASQVSTGVYSVTIDTTPGFGTYGYEVVTDGSRRHRAFDAKSTTDPAPAAATPVIDGGSPFTVFVGGGVSGGSP